MPANAASVQVWVRAQINGGLKVSSNGVALEQVKTTITDVTPVIGDNNPVDLGATGGTPAVFPWHTYRVDVKIIDSGNAVQASRSVTFTTVQAHIQKVLLGRTTSASGVDTVRYYEVPTGSASGQLMIGGDFDTVAIKFNADMRTERSR